VIAPQVRILSRRGVLSSSLDGLQECCVIDRDLARQSRKGRARKTYVSAPCQRQRSSGSIRPGNRRSAQIIPAAFGVEDGSSSGVAPVGGMVLYHGASKTIIYAISSTTSLPKRFTHMLWGLRDMKWVTRCVGRAGNIVPPPVRLVVGAPQRLPRPAPPVPSPRWFPAPCSTSARVGAGSAARAMLWLCVESRLWPAQHSARREVAALVPRCRRQPAGDGAVRPGQLQFGVEWRRGMRAINIALRNDPTNAPPPLSDYGPGVSFAAMDMSPVGMPDSHKKVRRRSSPVQTRAKGT